MAHFFISQSLPLHRLNDPLERARCEIWIMPDAVSTNVELRSQRKKKIDYVQDICITDDASKKWKDPSILRVRKTGK